jgi:hypothetical protein
MEPLAAQSRLRDFEIAACRRKVAQTGRMIAEEDRTGIRDPRHFAYSTVAKAAGLRRDNLLHSIAPLRLQLDSANAALQTALERNEALPMDRAGHAA